MPATASCPSRSTDDRLVPPTRWRPVHPEVFVLDGDFVLRYRGRIDDTWPPA